MQWVREREEWQRERERERINAIETTSCAPTTNHPMREYRINAAPHSQSLQGIVEYNEFQHNVTVVRFWFMLSALNGQANFCSQEKKNVGKIIIIINKSERQKDGHERRAEGEWNEWTVEIGSVSVFGVEMTWQQRRLGPANWSATPFCGNQTRFHFVQHHFMTPIHSTQQATASSAHRRRECNFFPVKQLISVFFSLQTWDVWRGILFYLSLSAEKFSHFYEGILRQRNVTEKWVKHKYKYVRWRFYSYLVSRRFCLSFFSVLFCFTFRRANSESKCSNKNA